MNYCPNHDELNGTCIADKDSYCFSSVELQYDKEVDNYVEFRAFGCLSKQETGLMQVCFLSNFIYVLY